MNPSAKTNYTRLTLGHEEVMVEGNYREILDRADHALRTLWGPGGTGEGGGRMETPDGIAIPPGFIHCKTVEDLDVFFPATQVTIRPVTEAFLQAWHERQSERQALLA